MNETNFEANLRVQSIGKSGFRFSKSRFRIVIEREIGFQRSNICFWIFIFTVRLGNPKKDMKNCPQEQQSCTRTHN